MTSNQKPAQSRPHVHLKESLKKQGKSDELAEQIAAQTVAQAAVNRPAEVGKFAPSEKDTRTQNPSLPKGRERRIKDDVSGARGRK